MFIQNIKDEEMKDIDINFQPSTEDVMKYMAVYGIMPVEEALAKMKDEEIKKVLSVHPFKIYQAKDGRWNTYIKDPMKKTGRRRIAKSSKTELFAVLYEAYTDDKPTIRDKYQPMTLRQLYPEWLEYKKLHTTASTTIMRLNNFWKKYYLDSPIIDIQIVDLRKIMLDNWAHEMIKSFQMTKKQYYNTAVIMRQALDYAVDMGYIRENPFNKVQIDKRMFQASHKKSSETQVFSEEEETAIKAHAWKCFENHTHTKQPLTALAVLFQFQTGLRIGELRGLRYEDISPDGMSINISRMIRNETGEVVEHTKGVYGDRDIILTDKALQIIGIAQQTQRKLGAPTDGYIFSVNDKPIGYCAVNKALYKYCDDLGIPRRSTHKTRKTVISSLIDAGMNIDTVRRFAGHTDERTTYNNYCYDRRSDDTNLKIMNNALE